MSKRDEVAINATLEKIAPEIAASMYGKYPMEGTRWLTLTDLTPEGLPTYLKEPNVGPKKDYVHGIAPYGEAYYHLLTKTAYTVLYNRAQKDAPSSLCPCFLSVEARQNMKEYDDALEVLLFRTRASIPDDAQAARDVMMDAKNLAEGANAFHLG
jgi:hypothetical protein